MREKSKKLAAAARNAPRKKNQKWRGLKRQDGHYVAENNIVANQFNKLQYHPGLNVWTLLHSIFWGNTASIRRFSQLGCISLPI